jgi:hypothetical protein
MCSEGRLPRQGNMVTQQRNANVEAAKAWVEMRLARLAARPATSAISRRWQTGF